METLNLSIEGMSCNHCKMAVEQALKTLQGVAAAEVDLKGKSAKVFFDPGKVKPAQLKAVIVEAGYEVLD